jgi:tetrapyrrole methylase family protein/MazG family protein/ATP diphosphatase
MQKTTDSFVELIELIRTLRGPNGCPWDRKQTPSDVKTYLVEELYEVLEAIDRGDKEHLQEEVGDLLFMVLFLTSLYEESKTFTLGEAIDSSIRKMVHRHPHVFGDTRADTVEEIKDNWQRLKEKEGKPPKKSLLGNIPTHLPALYQSFRMTLKAAKVGFDWENPGQVLEKIKEEIAELEEALQGADREKKEQEMGDLLFSAANLSRHLEIEPEQALRACNEKFYRRFCYVEQELQKQGKTPREATLAEMDELWEDAKKLEQKNINRG